MKRELTQDEKNLFMNVGKAYAAKAVGPVDEITGSREAENEFVVTALSFEAGLRHMAARSVPLTAYMKLREALQMLVNEGIQYKPGCTCTFCNNARKVLESSATYLPIPEPATDKPINPEYE